MKIIHRDPVLRAQRVAAIKKTKGTPAARKHASETMKAYFSNPENRRKRSVSMLGSKYKCSHCGGRGHRRHYCPERKGQKLVFTCKLCGEKGHNKTKCPNVEVKVPKRKQVKRIKCAICGKYGHNQKTCPQPQRLKLIQLKKGISEEEAAQRLKASRMGLVPRCTLCGGTRHNKRTCGLPQQRCTLCGRRGHNRTTCPAKNMLAHNETDSIDEAHNGTKSLNAEDKVRKYRVERRIKCAICGKYGHTRKTCPKPKRLKLIQLKMGISEEEAAQRLKYTRLGMTYGCTLCGKRDHNRRTCGRKLKLVPRRKCTLCGKVGHNLRTCILNITLDGTEADSNDQGFSYSDHGRSMSESSVVPEAF